MKTSFNTAAAVAAFGAALLAGAPAQAAWDFTRAGTTVMGSSFSQAGTTTGGVAMSADVSAWSAAKPPDTFTSTSMTIWGSSGIGIPNDPGEADTPEHGVDNLGNTDAVVLSFASSVALSQVRLGWYSGDSDITVLRWIGDVSGPVIGAVPNMADMTWSGANGLIASGWELVSSYADLGTTARDINADGKASSWWLISAYNSSYGGQTWSEGNDYFKLASVAGNTVKPPGDGGGSAPEPASLALVAVGLLGTLGVRRRKQK